MKTKLKQCLELKYFWRRKNIFTLKNVTLYVLKQHTNNRTVLYTLGAWTISTDHILEVSIITSVCILVIRLLLFLLLLDHLVVLIHKGVQALSPIGGWLHVLGVGHPTQWRQRLSPNDKQVFVHLFLSKCLHNFSLNKL